MSKGLKEMSSKIMVVDDNKGIRSFLNILLTSEGYEVYEANNGKEAIDLSFKYTFSLIIMDIKMLGMSGLDVFSYIKKTDPQISILVITAYPVLILLNQIKKVVSWTVEEEDYDYLQIN